MTTQFKHFFVWMMLLSFNAFSQAAPFEVLIEPVNINGMAGLQAFAWAQHNGKILVIGGRKDGLHKRQPFAAFDVPGHNTNLTVFDPLAQQSWSAPLASLPTALQEQLSSTNMQFYQEGDYLYVAGGYGYSATSADHITYPYLTAVKVPDVINAVINAGSFTAYFRQITDTMFALTGGYFNKIYNTYYLTGGQKFIGRYNPMGPNNGPGFVQVYSNAIRKFLINDNGISLSVTHLPSIIDTNNLHRRDYNVAPQIMPNGEEGLTAFSGVFQKNIDLPYLNCVNIDSNGHNINNAFSQYFNHYHCAHIPLYSVNNNEMHTLFFGGIAQYYDSAGVLVQDNNVPFVKTIARVTRTGNGIMTEYKLPVEMPALLGAGSEFIPVESLPHYNNEVIQLDNLLADTTLAGYIYGGINSTAPNIFFVNNGTQSTASSQLFKVFIIKKSTLGIDQLNTQSIGSLKMMVFPNPNDGDFTISYYLKAGTDTKITIHTQEGQLMEQITIKNQLPGDHLYTKSLYNKFRTQAYIITLKTKFEKVTQKMMLHK
jgi:hypothetical protein